ncbi:C4-dicarboxylate ABC transporter [Comamonadaceae bacterium OH2545_COT-014]|nr:C4-dicarboxylate ABC transporter [Comamonadaceae bacterium OH2545_COT-014]
MRPQDPLQYLHPGWFAIVMGLAGLALAWARASALMGPLAGAGALVLGALAALVFVALAGLSWLRWQRHPQALAADLAHPVRHAFVAAPAVSLLLLANVAVNVLGDTGGWVAALWWAGSLAQLGATVWVLGRWLRAGKGGGQAAGWPPVTPALFIPVVGNVLAPLAGVAVGAGPWAVAQFGLGLVLWPVLLALLLARVAAQGLWAERLLPLTFITIAPPAVAGVAALQLGWPVMAGWMAWGTALFFLLWSATVARRMLAQPLAVTAWALSFPLAAFAVLSLRLAAQGDAGAAFGTLALLSLALASLVVAVLGLATVKGLRNGSLLQPEAVPVASAATAAGPAPH